jgi:hypothetical protein
MTQLEGALVEITSVLEELHIRYMLIGGLAVSVWGEPRATLDVDLSLWVDPGDFAPKLSALCERIRAVPQDALAFATETRVLPVVSSEGVRADLVFAALPSEREAIDRATPKHVGGKTVMVCSVEDLILMKLISERQKDLEDARRLIGRFRDSIDRAYLEPRLIQLAEALARPGIVEVFRQEARR